jgi:DNA invertase Pin-like site-specific DNA recombinase
MENKEKKSAAIFCNIRKNDYVTMPSIELQEAECKKAFDRFVNEKSTSNEKWLLQDVFVANMSAPREAAERLSEIACGRLDVLLVYSFDRIAESITELLQFFREDLNLFGCNSNVKRTELISVKEGLNTTTTFGQDALITLAAFAELAIDETANTTV